MQNAAVQITLNMVTEIPVDRYDGFFIKSSIEEGLPYGWVKILDPEGVTLAQFENLQIGADINLKLTDTQNDLNIFDFPQFKVLYIEDDCELNYSMFAGSITIWFGHPWFLYKDIKNHAYKPMDASELIKKILTDRSRGMRFTVKDENFDVCDETEIGSFKICESDWDFIHNKILPYTSINQLPVHFFCNHDNQFFLRSFENMFKQNPKALLMPAEELIADEDNAKNMKSIIDNNNLFSTFQINAAWIKIGNEKIIKELYPSFYFENLVNNSFVNGNKKPANKLMERNGALFGNILPLDKKFMDFNEGTSVKVIHNRPLISSMILLFQTSKIIDNMFEITVSTNFTGEALSIGDTVHIYVPIFQIENEKKKSWINGKWMIKQLDFMSSDNDRCMIITQMTLMRPSFVGDTQDTTLSMHRNLYVSP